MEPDDRHGSFEPAPTTGERRGDRRLDVAIVVRCHYESVLDFVETQSVNISVSGMFIATDRLAPLGSKIRFEFTLSEGFKLLEGIAEVVRVVPGGAIGGMGVRFVDLAPQYRKLIERIVSVNADEGRSSRLNLDFSRPIGASPAPPAAAGPKPPLTLPGRAPETPRSPAAPPAAAGARTQAPVPAAAGPPPAAPPPAAPRRTATAVWPATPPLAPLAPLTPAAPPPASTGVGVTITTAVTAPAAIHIDGKALRVTLGPTTVAHFTSNPLLNIRAGGFFIPVDEDVGLGAVLDVEITDASGGRIAAGKGKVVAKQQLRIGVRLTEVDKEVLARLQAEVAKLAPRK